MITVKALGFTKRRAGVLLVEVLIAMLVLTIAVFVSFETIGYALSITTEVRGRMKNYARLEYAGLLSVASGDIALLDDVECSTANFTAPITIGTGTKTAEITNVVYKRAFDANETQKMRSPVFVVFLKKTGP
jgi:Tfp pilus assembly protein PilV